MDPTSGNILIVDDDPLILKTYDRIFHSEGYAVKTAASAEEALRLQEVHPYDLILLDMILPGMNGIEFLRTCKKLRVNPLVIVITGFATLDTAIEATKLGAYGFIAKPCRIEDLLAKVDQVMLQRKDPLIAFIKENIRSIQSREAVAQRFGVSPGTVLNRIKRTTQLSFFEFLQSCRIDQAKNFLEETELNISQIAERVGFHTPQAFTRTFRRLTGYAPRQFRKFSRLHLN
jgi:YesN/AraC family two-component response regulator